MYVRGIDWWGLKKIMHQLGIEASLSKISGHLFLSCIKTRLSRQSSLRRELHAAIRDPGFLFYHQQGLDNIMP
jgi:hypothetical protein